MDTNLQEFIIEKTREMVSVDYCRTEARKAAEAWLASIGTDSEPQAIKNYLAELEEAVMPIDELIEFCKGEYAFFIFGNNQQEEIAHAYKLKADGAEYCDCPACKAALAILEKKREILSKSEL